VGLFQAQPGRLPVARRAQPGPDLSHSERRNDGDPVEFVGQAGDVCIWHSLIFHSASINKRSDTRFVIFGRWGVRLSGGPVYDFNADM
jgi:hypothetical protein